MSSIQYEHRDEETDTSHEVEIEYEIAYEPDDPNYGADADGNRGVYVKGGYYTETDPPYRCDVCKKNFTKSEREQIEKLMQKDAATFNSDY